jgi:hypothetical protein
MENQQGKTQGMKKGDKLGVATLMSRTEGSQVPVADAHNPSYSGGRDQDLGLKPAWANNLQDPILKKLNTKKGLVE